MILTALDRAHQSDEWNHQCRACHWHDECECIIYLTSWDAADRKLGEKGVAQLMGLVVSFLLDDSTLVLDRLAHVFQLLLLGTSGVPDQIWALV